VSTYRFNRRLISYLGRDSSSALNCYVTYYSECTARKMIARIALSTISVLVSLVLGEMGVRIVYSHFYPDLSLWVNHSVLGYHMRANHRFSFDSSEGYKGEFTTNQMGLVIRNSLKKKTATLTVMFLGDSMLQGTQVAPNENLTEILSRQMGYS